MILGGTFLVLLAVAIRDLQDRYSVLQMIFMRSVISFLLVLPWVLNQRQEDLQTRRLGLHCFRNTIHYVGNVGWFIGVTLVPLADLSALQFTVPLFTICFAALFLPERIGLPRWIATAIGFTGAIVIIRPGLIEISLGTIAVVSSAACYAASQVSTKSLSKTDSPNAILFYMSIIFIPISIGPALTGWVTPLWEDALPIFLLGLFGYLAHACIIRSFAAADASFVMPFDFLRLPIATAIGFFLFYEKPDLWSGSVPQSSFARHTTTYAVKRVQEKVDQLFLLDELVKGISLSRK